MPRVGHVKGGLCTSQACEGKKQTAPHHGATQLSLSQILPGGDSSAGWGDRASGSSMSGRCWSGFREGREHCPHLGATLTQSVLDFASAWQGGATRSQVDGISGAGAGAGPWNVGLLEAWRWVLADLP